MAEVYISLGEAAELENVKYKTMAQRLSRKPGEYDTRTEKSGTGGKDTVLVAVSSLSKQARNAWREREKLKALTEEREDGGGADARQELETPWYVDVDIDWYIENYKESYYRAMELGNVVRRFLQYDEETAQSTRKSTRMSTLAKGRGLYTDMPRLTWKHPPGRTSWGRRMEPVMTFSRFSACAGNPRRRGHSQVLRRK